MKDHDIKYLISCIEEAGSVNRDLLQVIKALHLEIKKLHELNIFWNGEIPSKYIKAFPRDDESIFFNPNTNFKKSENIRVTPDPLGFVELEYPKDPVEFKKAKERMTSYGHGKKLALVYALFDEQDCYVGERGTEALAQEWVDEVLGRKFLRRYKTF